MRRVLPFLIALAIPASAQARTSLLWSDSDGLERVTFLYDAKAQHVLVGCRGEGTVLIWLNHRLSRCHDSQPYTVRLRNIRPGERFRSFERFLPDVSSDTASWSRRI